MSYSQFGTSEIKWKSAVRIIRSLFPPIDLFEDIADPADWPLLISAEQKTNPRLMETIGNIEMVPPERRVGGSGASYLMAPFTHCSIDRPSRFSDGRFGVLYVARHYETALFETIHHHALFMSATRQPAGWTSQFRELVLDVDASLVDLRKGRPSSAQFLNSDSYLAPQKLGSDIRAGGADGIVYPSLRHETGECAVLFFPDLASNVTQGRHLDYHWNGTSVDFVRDATSGEVFQLVGA